MSVIVFVIPLATGFLSAFIQIKSRNSPLRKRLAALLLVTVAISFILGFRAYRLRTIDINTLYTILVNAGTAIGILILFERLLLKFIWMPLVAGLIIGLIALIIVHQHVQDLDRATMLQGLCIGLGYLLCGMVLKNWRRACPKS